MPEDMNGSWLANLAIILSGGGLKCSYGAGVLLALSDKYAIQEPSLLISCSGSAGTGSYFISKQYDAIKNVWSNLLSTKKLVNYSRFWKAIDIDYLIDDVFKKQSPLNLEELVSSPINYLIPALNRKTGKIDYFSKNDDIDIYESMRATKAMPLAYNLNPNIKIKENTYCDSKLTANAKTHIKKAVELGAKRIILVDQTPITAYPKKTIDSIAFDLWISFQDPEFKKNYYEEEERTKNYTIPDDVSVITLCPKKSTNATLLNNNQKLLEKTIELGYRETCFNYNLQMFLEYANPTYFNLMYS